MTAKTIHKSIIALALLGMPALTNAAEAAPHLTVRNLGYSRGVEDDQASNGQIIWGITINHPRRSLRWGGGWTQKDPFFAEVPFGYVFLLTAQVTLKDKHKSD